jgi:hypothetical protein
VNNKFEGMRKDVGLMLFKLISIKFPDERQSVYVASGLRVVHGTIECKRQQTVPDVHSKSDFGLVTSSNRLPSFVYLCV